MPRPAVHRPIAAALGALGAALALRAAGAQGAAPRHAEQGHAWLQLFEEHRLDPRWSIVSDAQLRRADVAGTRPQQLLLRGGVQRAVAAGASVAAGYAYVATSVYGDAPAPAPFDEHRIWQQVQLGHRTGAVAWAHRFRAEQRWVQQTTASHPWRFRQRVRTFTRATVDAPSLGVPVRRAYVTPWAELFVAVGGAPNGQLFDQSRLALQAGYRLTPRLRVEAGYMQQYIQRGGSRETENNRTLVVTVFSTTGR